MENAGQLHLDSCFKLAKRLFEILADRPAQFSDVSDHQIPNVVMQSSFDPLST
jgi:hypothetical protein